ncbi:DUF6421 family protein [Actinomadura rayongensis]|uniref:Uncharacterized protein n=1 Tax=Actinomadura rayongensis TaxID=1429076 RepID=A0A6I4WML3_9ACTN|nr:DUF6421 family protein [Actinomadura rayongensis]MXQ67902.1 hypothetical protein [Actinomadura rayongensis]
MAHPPFPRVLVDEAHGQAWSIRPDVVARMNPAHPRDSGYVEAAADLRRRGCAVAAHPAGPLTGGVLERCDVLVLAHPSDPVWERTVPGGSPKLSPDELDAVERFVRAGGGLVVLGECEQDKYGNNLNELLGRFGVHIANTTVQDPVRNLRGVATWVRADLDGPRPGADVLAGVADVCFYRAATIDAVPDDARVLCRTAATASVPGAALAVAVEAGRGRIAVFADSDLFGDDSIDDLGHRTLWANTVAWAAGGRAVAPVTTTGALDRPAWPELKEAVTALRELQGPDGSVVGDATALVDRIVAAVEELAPGFPHDERYLTALVGDLRRWAAEGFGVPDFLDALVEFHPERDRADGREHLVVFPMYTQNGSPDRRLEALIVRAVWPGWLAELEAAKYDNPMFVPISFVDFTAGYDTNSAVLFPETVAVREVPRFTWGGIFCDREAARFRAVGRAAVDTLRLAVPPDAARLLDDQRLAQDAFVLWDLVHDRTHTRGDLPFDPFMVKQRMPYWMYALEELRCDLNAYREAVALEDAGVPYGRLVRYAILFDRLFRFPITGGRVKNYDGLGGQLLFAHLHRAGVLRWTDNVLRIDWRAVSGAVLDLCAAIERLYHDGIDRSRVAHWLSAHELVASYVAPNPASTWAKGPAALPMDGPPRGLVDAVLPDEFPLNTFYEALQRRLRDVVAATSGITG